MFVESLHAESWSHERCARYRCCCRPLLFGLWRKIHFHRNTQISLCHRLIENIKDSLVFSILTPIYFTCLVPSPQTQYSALSLLCILEFCKHFTALWPSANRSDRCVVFTCSFGDEKIAFCPVLNCQPVRGVPRLLPNASWDWLQPLHDPRRRSSTATGRGV